MNKQINDIRGDKEIERWKKANTAMIGDPFSSLDTLMLLYRSNGSSLILPNGPTTDSI